MSASELNRKALRLIESPDLDACRLPTSSCRGFPIITDRPTRGRADIQIGLDFGQLGSRYLGRCVAPSTAGSMDPSPCPEYPLFALGAGSLVTFDQALWVCRTQLRRSVRSSWWFVSCPAFREVGITLMKNRRLRIIFTTVQRIGSVSAFQMLKVEFGWLDGGVPLRIKCAV